MSYRPLFASLTLFAALLTSGFGICSMPLHNMTMESHGYAWQIADDCPDTCPLATASNAGPYDKFSQADPRFPEPLKTLPVFIGFDRGSDTRIAQFGLDEIKPPELNRSDGSTVSNPVLARAYSQGILNPKLHPNV